MPRKKKSKVPANHSPKSASTTDPDTAGPVARLPNEILAMVARASDGGGEDILDKKDLARCTRVSRAFLEIFGAKLYRHVTLRDIGKPLKNRTTVRRKLLSFVEVLEVHRHRPRGSSPCAHIARLCTRLGVIVVSDDGLQLGNCSSKRPCGCVPTDRPITLLTRPYSSFPYWDRDELLSLSNGLDAQPHPSSSPYHAVHRAVEFEAAMGNSWVTSRLYPKVAPLQELVLIHSPVTQWDLAHDYGPQAFDRNRNRIDLDRPRESHGWACDYLAGICAAIPNDCTITCVNFDQMPLWTDADTSSPTALRLKNGQVVIRVDPKDHAETDLVHLVQINGAVRCGSIIPPDQASLDKAVNELENRITNLRAGLRLTMGAALRKEGAEEELDDRMARIKFITLKEYLDDPKTENEWITHPDRHKWL